MKLLLGFAVMMVASPALAQVSPSPFPDDESSAVSSGGMVSGNLKLDIASKLILNWDGAGDSYLAGDSDNSAQFWTTGTQVWSTSATNFTVDVPNLDFAGTGAHHLILDDGNGTGNTEIIGEANGDMSFYSDGTLQFYIDASGNALVMQSSSIKYASAIRTIYNSAGPLEIGLNHTPSHATATNSDASVQGSLEVNTNLYVDGANTKGATTQFTTSTETLTFAADPGDATKTTSGLIPDGAIVLGVTTRVTTAATNCTSVNIGDGSDADMFGAATALTQDTTTDNSDATAQFVMSPATAATEVTITGVGANCFDGAWAITAHYILPSAATSN